MRPELGFGAFQFAQQSLFGLLSIFQPGTKLLQLFEKGVLLLTGFFQSSLLGAKFLLLGLYGFLGFGIHLLVCLHPAVEAVLCLQKFLLQIKKLLMLCDPSALPATEGGILRMIAEEDPVAVRTVEQRAVHNFPPISEGGKGCLTELRRGEATVGFQIQTVIKTAGFAQGRA